MMLFGWLVCLFVCLVGWLVVSVSITVDVLLMEICHCCR